MKSEGKMQSSADDYRSRMGIQVRGRVRSVRRGSVSVLTIWYLPLRLRFIPCTPPFYLKISAGSMNLSFLNDPSPGSSVFDFPAHRETTHKYHTGASTSLLAPGPADSGSFIVLSGGTGCNPICSAFGPDACYVLPISDDGGSSSEIIRVLGGPSIGVYGCSNDTVVSIYLSTKVT